ncbi:MAG: hypothetical protein EAZ66_03865, partial [Alphaproteobacteria bacterium]
MALTPPLTTQAMMQERDYILAQQKLQTLPASELPNFANPGVMRVIGQPYAGPTESEAAIGAGVQNGFLAALGGWVVAQAARISCHVEHNTLTTVTEAFKTVENIQKQELVDAVAKAYHGSAKDVTNTIHHAIREVNGGWLNMFCWNKPDIDTMLSGVAEFSDDIAKHIKTLHASGKLSTAELEKFQEAEKSVGALKTALVAGGNASVESAKWTGVAIAAVAIVAGGVAAMKAAENVRQSREEHEALRATAAGLRQDFEGQYVRGIANEVVLESAQAKLDALTNHVTHVVPQYAEKDKVIDAVAKAPSGVKEPMSEKDKALHQAYPEVAKLVDEVSKPKTTVMQGAEVAPMIAREKT